MAIGLLDCDHRVAQLDQVFLLHIEQLPANLLGFLLGRKRDFHEIGHLCHLPAVSKFDATLNKRSARPGRFAAIRGVGQILAPDPAPPRSPNPASSPTPTGTPAPPASRPTPAPARTPAPAYAPPTPA